MYLLTAMLASSQMDVLFTVLKTQLYFILYLSAFWTKPILACLSMQLKWDKQNFITYQKISAFFFEKSKTLTIMPHVNRLF